MKLFITGGSSLPGYRVLLESIEKGYDITALYKDHPIPLDHENLNTMKLDITDFQALKNLINAEKPDVILHMAALGNVDLCERDTALAWRINVEPTIQLAKSIWNVTPFLIYLSTDYIFDGEVGNYSEDDPPNPVDYYGLTKLLGEIACTSAGVRCAIIRASSIYGFGPGRTNFAKFLVEKLEKGETVKALIDQYTTPTQATLLAKAIHEIIDRKMEGIFHVVGEKMSRYEFAVEVAKTLEFDASLIKEARLDDMNWYAKRPTDSSINSDKTRTKLKVDFYSNSAAFTTLKTEYTKDKTG
jgi:dTDP-4-dehydrorhamnose reductase